MHVVLLGLAFLGEPVAELALSRSLLFLHLVLERGMLRVKNSDGVDLNDIIVIYVTPTDLVTIYTADERNGAGGGVIRQSERLLTSRMLGRCTVLLEVSQAHPYD